MASAARLREWLRARGFWVEAGAAAGDAGPLTHVFLDGGRARVPLCARGELLDQYAALAPGGGLYAVERAVGTYRMFADFDVAGDAAARADLGALLARSLACLPAPLRRGTVAVCSRRAAGKAGLHLVWADAWVDDPTARALRDAWVAACVEADSGAGAGGGGLAWDSVIDAAVYRRSGLRMPWSWKRGAGAESAYLPSHTVSFADAEPRVEAVAAPAPHDVAAVRAWLDRVSLRAGEGQAVDPLCAAFAPPSAGARGKRKAPPGVAGVGALLDADAEAALRAVLPPEYSCAPLSLRATLGGARAAVIGCGSRHCLAAGRAHGTSGVFFVVSEAGAVTQRCFSPQCPREGTALPALPADAVARLLGDPVPGRGRGRFEATPAAAAGAWLVHVLAGAGGGGKEGDGRREKRARVSRQRAVQRHGGGLDRSTASAGGDAAAVAVDATSVTDGVQEMV